MLIALALANAILAVRDPAILAKKPYAAYGTCLLAKINAAPDRYQGATYGDARTALKDMELACTEQRAQALATGTTDADKKLIEGNTRRFEKMIEQAVVPSSGARGSDFEDTFILELN